MIERILTTILYVPTVPDWRPEEATPLAGFSLELCETSPYLGALTHLPTTILDFMPENHAGFLSRRLTGTAPLEVHPQSPRAIRSMPIPEFAPFTVLILSPGEDSGDYREWVSSCTVPPVLVSRDGKDLGYQDLTLEGLQKRLLKLCADGVGQFAPDALEDARSAVAAWRALPVTPLDYEIGGHGSVRPNLAALHVAGREPRFAGPFKRIGDDRAPYVEQIVRTAVSILDAREAQVPSLPEPSFPRRPSLTLFAPAMYGDLSSVRLKDDAPADIRGGFQNIMNLLRRQDGYSFGASTPAQVKAMSGLTLEALQAGEQPKPHPLFQVRQRETSMAVTMSELLCASEASASLRLPNEINRTAGAVRQFAAHYRAVDRKPQRTLTGFRAVQTRLAQATPPEFFDVIRQAGPDVRIIADAHLEWLDIDGLPLCLRKTVSRIPVTPGNLFVEQMTAKPIIRLMPETANKILVLSALKAEDEIRAMFDIAFSHFAPLWKDVLDVTFKEVANETDLVDALNAFDGAIVIFDGHGAHVPGKPAMLRLKDSLCDVWSLRGRLVSPPPIMVLSACDTHAADRNHATTANGFLALGVRAVLGSVFPLDARDAAVFVARLLYRYAAYVPEAVKMFDRALTWSEICSGLLRMQVETDLRRRLLRRKLLDDKQYKTAGSAGNRFINGGHPDPFAAIVDNLVAMGLARADVERELALAVAGSSAISYLHLGRPETILLDTNERLATAEAELAMDDEIVARDQ